MTDLPPDLPVRYHDLPDGVWPSYDLDDEEEEDE